jgi:hypothetical protein
MEEFQRKVFTVLVDRRNKGFKRSLIVAPTGTGKTALFLRQIEEVLKQGTKTIILMTSRLGLIPQYTRDAKRYGICLDNVHLLAVSATQIPAPWKTIPFNRLEEIYTYSGSKIIVCLYRYSDRLIEYLPNLRQNLHYPDLIVYDEAHNCAPQKAFEGFDFSFGSNLLKQMQKAETRLKDVKIAPSALMPLAPWGEHLFFTATPRVWPTKKSNQIFPMSNTYEDVFGPDCSHLSVCEAVGQKMIVPFQIVVLIIRSEAHGGFLTREQIVARALEKVVNRHRHRVEELFEQVPDIIKEKYYVRLLTYHNTKARCDAFIDALGNEFSVKESVHSTIVGDVREKIERYAKCEQHSAIMSSVNILTEGVSINNVNGIIFMDKKKSHLNICQIAGRGLRTHSVRGVPVKSKCDIVIPLVLQRNESLEDGLKNGGMKPIVDCLSDIMQDDQDWLDSIENLSDEERIELFAERIPMIVIPATYDDVPEEVSEFLDCQTEEDLSVDTVVEEEDFSDCVEGDFIFCDEEDECGVCEGLPKQYDVWTLDSAWEDKEASRIVQRTVQFAVYKRCGLVDNLNDRLKKLLSFMLENDRLALQTKEDEKQMVNLYYNLTQGRCSGRPYVSEILELGKQFSQRKEDGINLQIETLYRFMLENDRLASRTKEDEKQMANLYHSLTQGRCSGRPYVSEILELGKQFSQRKEDEINLRIETLYRFMVENDRLALQTKEDEKQMVNLYRSLTQGRCSGRPYVSEILELGKQFKQKGSSSSETKQELTVEILERLIEGQRIKDFSKSRLLEECNERGIKYTTKHTIKQLASLLLDSFDDCCD